MYAPTSHSSNLPQLLRLTPLTALFAIPSTIMLRSGIAAHRSRTSGSSNDERMSSILRHHYLGLHKMRLGNITCTEMVRTLSQPGLARVTQSIRDVGWLDQFAPSVVISREAVRDGEQLSAEDALKVAGRVLDGNHRVAALKKEFPEDNVFFMSLSGLRQSCAREGHCKL